VLNPFFSRGAILKMEPLIVDKVERLSQRFREASDRQSVVRLDAAYTAVTMDIITHYSYGESSNYVADENFKLEWKEALIGGVANGVLLRHFPWLLPILKAVPLSLLRKIDRKAASLVEWGLVVEEKVTEMLENNRRGNKADGTIFQTMLDSDLPPEEKSPARLQDEGQSIVGAGSETTARSLTILSFYFTQNPTKLDRVRQELKTVLRPEGEGWLPQLEKLPYLTACIQESLRLNHGVMGRLPRIAHNPLKYRDWVIPVGTPTSESNFFVHMDPTIFPEPEEFIPERWLKAQESGHRLDRYLVAFTKGSRSCLGINLAWAELYLFLAVILPRFDFEPFETTLEDIKPARDFFVPVPKLDSKGVRAKVFARDDAMT